MIAELDRARDALYAIDPGCERETWVKVAMGAKAAGLSVETFIDWSSTADNYGGEADCRSVWKSINGSGGIGPATLFGMARDAGWRDEANGHDRTPQKAPEPPKPRPRTEGQAFDCKAAWDAFEAATVAHGYVAAKLGLADGLRVVPAESRLTINRQSVAGWLAVPLWDGDNLGSMQFISPTGAKLTAPGPMRGWFTVGGPAESGSITYVCEGVGAAWSCHQATQRPAVVAFGLGRMQKVAAAVAGMGADVVLVGDVGTEDRIEKIAAEVGCRWVVPPAVLGRNGDANDLHQRDGLQAVAELLATAREPEREDEDGNSDRGRLQAIDFSDLDTNPPPPRRWVVRDWIPAATVTLLAGAGGVGKSLLIQQIANHVALGMPLFGGGEVVQGPVCGIFCEDDADELRRRQVKILRMLGRSAIYSSENLHLVARVGFDNALIAFGADRRMQRTMLLENLLVLAETTGSVLVIVDNIAQVFAGSENDRHEVSAFCGALAEICTTTGAAVVLLGHPAKAIGSEYSGSTAWEAAVRTRLYLDRRDDGLLELRRAKANYSSTGDTVVLAYDDGVLREANPADTSSAEAQAAEAAVLAALDTYTERQVATSHNPTARTNLIGMAMRDGLLPGVKREVGMRALNALVDRGEVLPGHPLPWKKSDRHQATGLARAGS